MMDLDPHLQALCDTAIANQELPAERRARIRGGLVARAGAAAFATTMIGGVAQGGAAALASTASSLTLTKAVLALALLGGAGTGAVRLASHPGTPHALQPSPMQKAVASMHRETAPESSVEHAVDVAPSIDIANGPPAAPLQPRQRQALPPRDETDRASEKPALAKELSLIAKAQAAIDAGDEASARALLQKHASQFPEGQFADEREGMQIVAACQSGAAGAKARAAQFVRQNPRSALVGRIHTACDTATKK